MSYEIVSDEAAIAYAARAEIIELREHLADAAKLLERMNLRCTSDPLNPCWDNRPTDIPSKHWGIGEACPQCHARAMIIKIKERESQ